VRKGGEMPELKYGKYVLTRAAQVGASGFRRIKYVGEEDFGSEYSVNCILVTEPNLMEQYPHAHDFDMYLTFVGLHENGIDELGGEIEFYYGEEEEKYTFTTPTTIYIPKGMIHCPLNFKKIDKPVLLIHATLASKYVKAPPIK
jgi:uncharacterized RmlC-like cupin family protein